MNRSLSVLSLVLIAVAGCAAPQEEEELGGSTDALSEIVDAPAEEPAGAKPQVETVDLSTIDFDLATLKDARGNYDWSKIKIDVLDTGRPDHDYTTRSSRDLNLKWVESDRRELPAFVETFRKGIDVGGGKCRIQSLSLKKVVVGCKWTW